MREILFRGKTKYDGLWVEGSLIHQTMFYGDPVDDYHILYNGEFNGDYYDTEEVIPETVGQFTGLHDKNGKKIFEGDIIKTKYGRLCIVTWFVSNQECCWDLKPIDTAKNIRMRAPTRIDLYSKDNLEVMGNVHDNPELLR